MTDRIRPLLALVACALCAVPSGADADPAHCVQNTTPNIPTTTTPMTFLTLILFLLAAACDQSPRDTTPVNDTTSMMDAGGTNIETRDPAEWTPPGADPVEGSICESSRGEMTYADWAHVSDAIVIGTISKIEPVTDVFLLGERSERDTIDACDPEISLFALDITLTDVEVLDGEQAGNSVTIRVGALATGFWNSVPGARIDSTLYRAHGTSPPPLASVPDGGVFWSDPSVGYVPGHRIGATLFRSDYINGYWTLDYPLMTVDNGSVTFQATTPMEEPCEVLPAPRTTTLDELRTGLQSGGTPTDHFKYRRSYYHEFGEGPEAARRILSLCRPPGDDAAVEPVDAGDAG